MKRYVERIGKGNGHWDKECIKPGVRCKIFHNWCGLDTTHQNRRQAEVGPDPDHPIVSGLNLPEALALHSAQHSQHRLKLAKWSEKAAL